MKTRTAVILAGGKGERLDPQNTIKPLVQLGHKPLIVWQIEQMLEAGMDTIYVVLGYQGEFLKKQILANPSITTEIKFIENSNWREGMFVSILTIANVLSGQAFFLSPCDLFFEENPYQLYSDEDCSYQGLVPLVSVIKEQEDRSGATARITVKEDGSISYSQPAQILSGVQTGIYHFGPGLMPKIKQIIQEQPEIKSFPSLLEYLSNQQLLKLNHFENKNWFDINTPAVRIRAEMFLRQHPNNNGQKQKQAQQLPKREPFNNFKTKKEAVTDIFVQQNCLAEIDSFEFIPEAHAGSPHFLITDQNVDQLHGEKAYQKLKNLGYNIKKIIVPPGEEAKTLSQFAYLAEKILAEGIDEKSILISLGGGTVNNVTGFLASTLYRGIYLIHIPTTFMAQCDAAIGIKQAVNGSKGKNLIGSYYEPLKIVIDPTILLTADDRWIRDGISESIKHALCQDQGFYDYLLNYNGSIKDVDYLEQVVKETIRLKTMLMEDDPKEKAEALVLQYGHTVGHAIEYLSGYQLGHGESISIGMIAATRISEVLGIIEPGLVEKHYNIFKKYNLPVAVDPEIKIPDIIEAMRYCKRYLYGDVQFVLLDKIGSLWSYNSDYSIPCDNDVLTKALTKCYEES